MSEKKSRRRWTAVEKLRVVLAGLEGSVEISELCRREGIHPTQYYLWKKQLQSSAGRIFRDGRSSQTSSQEQRLEAENSRLKSVVVELTTENLELKKGLSV
jgi:transposase